MKIKSRAWNLIVIIGSIAVIAAGFGGLFYFQSSRASASTVNWLIIGLGILTFLFFAGPGIAFAARKRIGWLKKKLPGGTLAWVRAHLYLPILALVAAYVHATSAPFRSALTSGKVLLGIAILVSIAGVARHHLIGVAKSAVNADAQISKIAAGQSRRFRQLVIDYKQLRRPLSDINADVATLGANEQAAWAKVVETQQAIDRDFPRGGGQSRNVRATKVLRAVHAPLTIVLFLTLGFHVVDVLGVTDKVASANEKIPSNASCAGCHTDIAKDFNHSTMAHGQTGTIMQAQLPVTLARNEQLAQRLGAKQQALVAAAGKVCINCHLPVGAIKTDDPLAVLPLNEGTKRGGPAVSDAGDAVAKDGISCTFCHTLSAPLGELAGAGPVNVPTGTRDDFGTVFGPLFRDPNPLPVRVHDYGTPDNIAFFNDSVTTSLACGACHNVKLDLDGDGTSPSRDADLGDDDGDRITNGNELDISDGTVDDLVLQTTFDEWQDYTASFDAVIKPQNPAIIAPLGCIDCHMPSNPDGAGEPVVDKAPGVLAVPDRPHRSHSFVGVEYDLDPSVYVNDGLDASAVNEILAEREALLKSAITLEVKPAQADASGTQTAEVVVRNNLMGHTFPTGFAFARQFWLEVSAVDQNGNPVCLVNPFKDQAAFPTPCSSGTLAQRSDPVPQCDPGLFALANGAELKAVPNGNIRFADALPAGKCDPWLANFQKILTDGDPDNTGTFNEVQYQSFLPDIVKVRKRMVDGLTMAPLQSVRLVPDANGALTTADSMAIPYTFAAAPGAQLKVTATMRFRHLPPEFIRGLATEQEQLDNVTDSARISDPEVLIKNLVVTDVVSAATNEGPVLACQGPQNVPGATILSCLKEVSGNGAVDLAAAGDPHAGVLLDSDHPAAAGAIVGGFTMLGGALAFRRRSRRAAA